jgi:hypothetical protein
MLRIAFQTCRTVMALLISASASVAAHVTISAKKIANVTISAYQNGKNGFL